MIWPKKSPIGNKNGFSVCVALEECDIGRERVVVKENKVTHIYIYELGRAMLDTQNFGK